MKDPQKSKSAFKFEVHTSIGGICGKMQIRYIKIRNFRSFGDEETIISLSKLSPIIGSNSTGKTALIQALVKLFSVNPNERSLVRGDFHVPIPSSDNGNEELELSIEVRIDFPELKEKGPSSKKKSVPPFFNQLVVGAPGEIPYLRVRLHGKWSPGNTPEGEVEQKLYFVTVAEGEEEKDALVPVSPHQRSAFQMIYVPAVREPLTQLKNASGTILWRILNNINWPKDIDNQIKTKMEPVNELFSGINGVEEIKLIVQEEWKKYHRDIRYQDASIEFSSTTLSSILKKIEVQFSPTQEPSVYTIDKLGDGLRSLFYLSLVSSLLEVEQKIAAKPSTAFTILAVEEPENHISPHLLGRVMDNLKSISSRENAQVLISSHSASIIKRVKPEDICHLRISENGSTIARKVHLPKKSDEAHTYIKEAVKAYPELYFAKLVILGEGDSEEIVLPKLLEANGVFVDDEGISIVPLGGRHVNHMWKLLHQLDIPHITLLDLDRERGGGGWERIEYILKQLLKNGHEREPLLKVNRQGKPHIISDDELNQFSERSLTPERIKTMDTLWLERLKGEAYNVFFSSPLDLDFLMLESFPDQYKKTVPRGPNIPDETKEPDEYFKKIKSGIAATLKNENKTGETYSKEQHELMVWYNTLFLGRGKPTTHLVAMLNITEEQLLQSCPPVLKDLVARIMKILCL